MRPSSASLLPKCSPSLPMPHSPHTTSQTWCSSGYRKRPPKYSQTRAKK
jgi:hypothetical protein